MMKAKEGDLFKRVSDGAEYTIKKVVNRMVVLESKDGQNQILTEIDNLKLKSFYQKEERVESSTKISYPAILPNAPVS